MNIKKNIKLEIINGALHLRRLHISESNLLSVFDDLDIFLKSEPESLYSFSLSYNENLGDIGLSKLLKILPASLREIGLVECGLTNSSAPELLKWIESMNFLDMICIEKNNFSSDIKSLIAQSSRRKGISLFI
jgi:hypothetical protein